MNDVPVSTCLELAAACGVGSAPACTGLLLVYTEAVESTQRVPGCEAQPYLGWWSSWEWPQMSTKAHGIERQVSTKSHGTGSK